MAMRSRPTGAASSPRPASAAIVANLPYNVAHGAADRLARERALAALVERMVLMFQKEVAERIVAAPGSKAYGRLAVIAQWRTRARLLFDVRAGRPSRRRPRSTSAVVEFDPVERPPPACRCATLERGHGRRLRPAPQDAAPEPQGARRRPRGAARRRRHRSDLRGEALTVRDFARAGAAC